MVKIIFISNCIYFNFWWMFNMKFVIIFLVVVLIIGLIKIRFKILYNKNEGLSFVIKIIFLKFNIFSSNENKQNAKDKNIEKAKKKEKKNILQTISMIKILIIPLPKLLKFLIEGLKITKLKLKIFISEEYAEKTALEYAKISCLAYNLVCLVNCYCKVKVKNEEIVIKPNFLKESSEYFCLLNFNIKIARIFIGLCIYFFNVLLELFSQKLFKKKVI